MTYVPAVIVLMLIYMTSLVGFITPHQQAWYLFYTPFFILLNALFLILYHPQKGKDLLQYMGLSMGIGFLVELVALQIGNLYGQYTFGSSLGPTALGVPFIMPIYWFMLAYSSACLAAKVPTQNNWLVQSIGTILMISLTFAIQQVAQSLQFWTLEGNSSIAFVFGFYVLVSFGLQYLFSRLKLDVSNPMALYVYGGLLLFFLGVINFL